MILPELVKQLCEFKRELRDQIFDTIYQTSSDMEKLLAGETIQYRYYVGSYDDEGSAEELISALEKLGINVESKVKQHQVVVREGSLGSDFSTDKGVEYKTEWKPISTLLYLTLKGTIQNGNV